MARRPTYPASDRLLHASEAARRCLVQPRVFLRDYVPRFKTLSLGAVPHQPEEGGRVRLKFPESVIARHIHEDLGTGNCGGDIPKGERLDRRVSA